MACQIFSTETPKTAGRIAFQSNITAPPPKNTKARIIKGIAKTNLLFINYILIR
jgi:hypothetical protein